MPRHTQSEREMDDSTLTMVERWISKERNKKKEEERRTKAHAHFSAVGRNVCMYVHALGGKEENESEEERKGSRKRSPAVRECNFKTNNRPSCTERRKEAENWEDAFP